MTFVANWAFPILVVLLAGTALLVRTYRRRNNDGMPVLIYRPRRRGRGRSAPSVTRAWPRERGSGTETVQEPTHGPFGKSPGTPPATSTETPGELRVPQIVGAGEAPDGTLQLLPGRLKVRGGPRAGEEIRFVRVPGSPPEITFGRLAGPDFQHVQIQSPLVSRRHATLRFGSGVWTLRNESATNPTVLNGKPLGPGTEEVELRHGDQIEMGDASFVLHHQTRERVARLAGS